MTKRFDKILLTVAIILIATCAAFAIVFCVGTGSETAYAETQHAAFFGNDNHGSNHAGTRLTDSFLNSHIDEEGNYSLPSGNYYLGSDLTLSKRLYFAGSVNFCLNGYKLSTTAGPVITVDDGVSSATTEHPTHAYCRIFDCHSSSSCNAAAHKQHQFSNPIDNKTMTVDGGLITGGNGGGISIYSGILYIYNGTIAGNKSFYGGGGVGVTSGEFRMYGTATVMCNTAGWYGAGVAMGNNTKFLMKGGTIMDNVVPMEDYSRGGGVYLARGARFEMSAGTIRNNSSIRGGGVYFVGSTGGDSPAHVLLSGTAQIYDNKDEGKGEPVNIRGEDTGTVEVGGTFLAGVKIMLSADTSKLKIAGYDPTGQKLAPFEIFSDEGGKKTLIYNEYAENGVEWLDDHKHGDIVFKPLTKAIIEAYSYEIPTGNYYLAEAFGVYQTLKLSAGTQLCLNCNHIFNYGKASYTIELRDNCVLTNCRMGGGGNISSYSPVKDALDEQPVLGVRDQAGHIFCSTSDRQRNGGIIVRGNASIDGYGDGYVTVYGGHTQYGAGVYVESGSLTMNAGKITDCMSDENGGGVYVANGELHLNGGEISNNIANYQGGGVSVPRGNVTGKAPFKITKNIAAFDGGGIATEEATFDLADLSVSENRAATGGGMFAWTANVTGGKFDRNVIEDKQENYQPYELGGGGIFVMEGGTISGAEITNNTAEADGGGVFSAYDDLRLVNVTISGNTSKGQGGGAFVLDGNLEISGNSVIKNNDAKGGGESYSCDGTAPGEGGGIYVMASLTIKGLTLENNKATNRAPELNVVGGRATLADKGLTVSHNGNDSHIFVSQRGTLEISSIQALTALANGNSKVTLEDNNCRVTLASSLKADETSPTGKVKVGYAGGSMGTLVSKQSRDCDVDVSRYFEYVPLEGAILCCAVTKDVVETNSTHSLILDEDGVQFNDDYSNPFEPKHTMTCSLKCERCGEEVPDITVDSTYNEEALRPSCTQPGTWRYYYALTTAEIIDSLGDNAKYYSVLSEYSTSREIPSDELPAGHGWIITKQGDAITATCDNVAHDEERDGCKQTMTIEYHGIIAHEGTFANTYDGKPYELDISDPDGFRQHVPRFKQEIWYDDPLSSSCPTQVDEIKNAGDYTVKVFSLRSDSDSELEVHIKVQKALLTFSLNKSESTYSGKDVDGIEAIFGGVAAGDPLAKDTDYKLKFNDNYALPKNAGNYTVTIELLDTTIANNYTCSDEKTFVVDKAQLEKPAGQAAQELVYNGGTQAVAIEGFDAKLMTAKVTDGAAFENGLFSAKDFKEGGYQLTISISDKGNYEWNGGGDDDVSFALTIQKAALNFAVPKNDAYTGASFDLLPTLQGKGSDLLQKDRDYKVKYNGKSDLPVAADTYTVTVELEQTDLANNYVCTGSQAYIIAKAKIVENANFAPYKSGKQQIYDPSEQTSPDFPAFGEDGFPFDTAGGQSATTEYIVKTYGLDGGHADAERIIEYLDALKTGQDAGLWKPNADLVQDPDSYCVYFKIEAQYHETYFGYYILNVYSALYTITLSDKDLGLGAKSYGDEAISAEDIKSALQSKTESIIASAGNMHGADLKDELFADNKFTVYLMKDGARYLKNTFEIGAYSVHASYVTAEGDENKYIAFEWKLSGAEGDGRPAFEVGKRELTFEIEGSDKRPYASAAFDVDVTFAGLQNDEHLSKDRDYAVKFDGTDDLPIVAKTYKVTVELLDSDLAVNYKIKENASKDFEVQKADINLAVPQGTIYNGREVALFATINGEGDDVLIRGVDYFVKYDGQDILPQDAGTYEVEIQFAPASALAKNYNIPATQQFDIGRAQLEKPSAESENVTLEYNGGDRSINVGGFVADLMRAEVTGGVFNALSGLFSAKNVKDGGYKLTISLSNAKNYEWKDGNSDSVSFTLNITPATLEFETPQNDMYTGNAFDLFATLPGKGNDILVRGRDYAVKYDGKSDLPLAANTYEVTVELTRSELANNYVCGGAKNYTVAKAELQRPTASGRATLTYNGAEQSLKISDFVVEHMAAMTSAGASFEGGLFSAMNVGEHSLSISITDTVNFKWKDGKEEDSEFKLNITAAALDFEVPQGDVFNGREFLLLPTLRGENNDVLIRGKDYQVKFDGTDDLPVAAKTYEVTVELTRSELAKNYTCDGAKNYTVAKAKLQRPSAPQSSQSFVYNGEIQSMQIEGFVAEFMSATITDGASFGTFSGRFGAKNFRDGGYELKLAIADKNNYEWTDGSNDDVSFAIAISKAALDFELTAGESYDPNGYDILNAINGQSRDVLVNRVDFKLKFNGLDADPTKVGVYRVKAELLNTELANNYEMTTQEKTYSITKKSLEKPTVESVDLTYNGKIQFARISGFDYATMTADIEDFLGDRINGENAGTYSVVISIADVDDYQWADGSEDPITLTIEIARAALTFEATGEGVYDGEEKAANIIFGGLSGDDFLIAGEDYVVRYNGGDALPVGAGSYSVSVQLLDTVYANNYVMTTASQTYNVAKAKLAKLNSQQFSSEMHGKNKTFDIAGYDDEKYVLSGGDVKEGKLSVKKEGSYNVTVAIKDKANYTWEDGTNDDLIITMTVVDPRPIGFEGTVAMAVAIPASTVTLAGVALAVALKLRKKRKLPKPSEEDPA